MLNELSAMQASTPQGNNSAPLGGLENVLRDPSYLQHFASGPAGGNKTWDGRHHLGKLPSYDAMNDRYCKWIRKNGRRSAPGGADKISPAMERLINQPPGYSTMGPFGAASKQNPAMARSFPAKLPDLSGGGLPPIQQGWGDDPQPPAQPRGRDGAPIHAMSALEDGKHPSANDLRRPKMSRLLQGDRGQGGQSLSLQQLFSKSQKTICDLWDRLGIPEADRQQFATVVFAEVTTDNLKVMNDEIQRLLDRRNASVQVEKNVEIREGFLYLLQELAERVAVANFDKDKLHKEATPLVVSLRTASLDVVESIVRWRDVVLNPNATYLWKGVNYLLKMQDDLNFLAFSKIASVLDCPVQNNPLLYNGKARTEAAEGAAAPEDETTLHQANGGLVLPQKNRMKFNQLLSGKQAVDGYQSGPLPPVKQKRGEQTAADPLHARFVAAERVIRDEARVAALAKEPKYKVAAPEDGEDDDVPEEIEDDMDMAATEEETPAEVTEDEWLTSNLSKQRALENRAATRIQAVWRGILERRTAHRVLLERRSAVKIQKLARQYLAVKEMLRRRERYRAARKIQAIARGMLARIFVAHIHLEAYSATKIQACFRGYGGRKLARERAEQHFAAMRIQRLWRGYYVRSRLRALDMVKWNFSATEIQRVYRGYCVRKQPEFNPAKVRAAVVIQAWWKGILARERCAWLLGRTAAAIRLQAWWRGVMARIFVSRIRVKKEMVDYRDFLRQADEAAIIIQRVWRGYNVRKGDIRKRHAEQAASLSIQKSYRGWHARQILSQEQTQVARHMAAIRIQKAVRTWLAKTDFIGRHRRYRAAVTIQRWYRGYLVRTAVKVQKVERPIWSVPAELGRSLGEVEEETLQATHVHKQAPRRHRLSPDSAAEVIQRAWRVYLAKNCVAHLRTELLSENTTVMNLSTEDEHEYAATRIQAWIRGVQTRARLSALYEEGEYDKERQAVAELESRVRQLEEFLLQGTVAPLEESQEATEVSHGISYEQPSAEESAVSPVKAVPAPKEADVPTEVPVSKEDLLPVLFNISASSDLSGIESLKSLYERKDAAKAVPVPEQTSVLPALFSLSSAAELPGVEALKKITSGVPNSYHRTFPKLTSLLRVAEGDESGLSSLNECLGEVDAHIERGDMGVVPEDEDIVPPKLSGLKEVASPGSALFSAAFAPPSTPKKVHFAGPRVIPVAPDVPGTGLSALMRAVDREKLHGLDSLDGERSSSALPGVKKLMMDGSKGLGLAALAETKVTPRSHHEPKTKSTWGHPRARPATPEGFEGSALRALTKDSNSTGLSHLQSFAGVSPTASQPKLPLLLEAGAGLEGLRLMQRVLDEAEEFAGTPASSVLQSSRSREGFQALRFLYESIGQDTTEYPAIGLLHRTQFGGSEGYALQLLYDTAGGEFPAIDLLKHTENRRPSDPETPPLAGLHTLLTAAGSRGDGQGLDLLETLLGLAGSEEEDEEEEEVAPVVEYEVPPELKNYEGLYFVTALVGDCDVPFRSLGLLTDALKAPKPEPKAPSNVPAHLPALGQLMDLAQTLGEDMSALAMLTSPSVQTPTTTAGPSKAAPPARAAETEAQAEPVLEGFPVPADEKFPGVWTLGHAATLSTNPLHSISILQEALRRVKPLSEEAEAQPVVPIPPAPTAKYPTLHAVSRVATDQPLDSLRLLDTAANEEPKPVPFQALRTVFQGTPSACKYLPLLGRVAQEASLTRSSLEKLMSMVVTSGSAHNLSNLRHLNSILGHPVDFRQKAEAPGPTTLWSDPWDSPRDAPEAEVPVPESPVCAPELKDGYPLMSSLLSVAKGGALKYMEMLLNEVLIPAPLEQLKDEDFQKVTSDIESKLQMEEARALQSREAEYADVQLRKARREEFEAQKELAKHEAANKIQKNFRGLQGRQETAQKRAEVQRIREEQIARAEEEERDSAALKIQLAWVHHGRGNIHDKKFLAARTIQCAWRSAMARSLSKFLLKARTEFRKMQQHKEEQGETAAVMIQCAWRQAMARAMRKQLKQERHLRVLEPSVETIQRSLRCVKSRIEYNKRLQARTDALNADKFADLMQESALKCQLAFKSYKARVELAHREYLAREKRKQAHREQCAIRIQRTWRQKAARKELKRRQLAKRQKVEAQKSKEVAEEQGTIAAEEEAIARRQAEAHAKQQNAAAAVIQHAWLCYSARFMLNWKRNERDEARRVQTEGDVHKAQTKAVVVLQCWTRYGQAKRELKKRKEAVQRLRQAQAEADEANNAAAATIQRGYKSYSARFELDWRKHKKAEMATKKEDQQKETMQQEMERVKANLAEKRRAQKEAQAALSIQCAYRSHNASFEAEWRRQKKEGKEASDEAKAKLQARLAAEAAVKEQEEQARQLAAKEANKEAASKKKQHQASTELQRVYRGHASRMVMKARRAQLMTHLIEVAQQERVDNAAIKIQSTWRRYIARCQAQYLWELNEMEALAEDEETQGQAAAEIQAFFRGERSRAKRDAMAKQMELERTEGEAATRIQSVFKGGRDRTAVKKEKEAQLERERVEVESQRNARVNEMWKAQAGREVEVAETTAAEAIQRVYKGSKARGQYQAMKEAKKSEASNVSSASVPESKGPTTTSDPADTGAAGAIAELREALSTQQEDINKKNDDAAVEIQRVWRGKEARTQLDNRKLEREAEEARIREAESAKAIQKIRPTQDDYDDVHTAEDWAELAESVVTSSSIARAEDAPRHP